MSARVEAKMFGTGLAYFAVTFLKIQAKR